MKPTVEDLLTSSVNAGYKMANKQNYNDMLKYRKDYDSRSPDVISVNEQNHMIMVASGGLKDLLEDANDGVLIYMTLDKSTKQEAIDALAQKSGFFYQDPKTGDHIGCIQLSLDQPLEMQLAEVNAMDLKHKPYAFNEDSISLLPMFSHAREAKINGITQEEMSLDDCSKKITLIMGDAAKSFDIPDELSYVKMGNNVVKEKELLDNAVNNRPSQRKPSGMSLRH